MRAGLLVAIALATGSCGRACSSCGASTPGGAAEDGRAAFGRDGGGAEGRRLTAPLSGTVARGAVVVAALDPERHAVVVTRLDRGAVTWRADVLPGVAASHGAALQAQASGEDVALFWRGPRDGRAATDATLVAPDGGLRGPPFATGSLSCATESGVVWIEAPAKAQARAYVRADGGVTVAASLGADRELELACGTRRAFVLARDDDQVSVTSFEATGASRTDVLARAADPLEEEREHAVFVTNDELGVVRVAASGALTWREVRADGAGEWRRTTARLAREDDLVALDANARAFVIVTTRAEEGVGGRVDAIWVDRATGIAKVHALAPGHRAALDPVGFVVMPSDDALVVAWMQDRSLFGRRIDAQGHVDMKSLLPPGTEAFAPLDCTHTECRVAILGPDGTPRVVPLTLVP